MADKRLRFVIFLDAPGRWVVRGLEHDLAGEGRSIGQAMRAVTRLVFAHVEFDVRHGHEPLTAFPAAAQGYWNAYAAGTEIPLEQLGVAAPPGWEMHAAFATRLPSDRPPDLVAASLNRSGGRSRSVCVS